MFLFVCSPTLCAVIGAAGAKALAREIGAGAMRTLRVLDLGGNGIGDEGCEAIAAAVTGHPSLVGMGSRWEGSGGGDGDRTGVRSCVRSCVRVSI